MRAKVCGVMTARDAEIVEAAMYYLVDGGVVVGLRKIADFEVAVLAALGPPVDKANY